MPVLTLWTQTKGFTIEQIDEIQNIYRVLYMSGLNTTQALDKIDSEFKDSEWKKNILDFVKNSTRGIVKGPTA